MVDPRQNLTEQVANEVRTHFDGQGLRRPPIPRNVRLSEAPSFGKPILLYDIASKGAKSYLELAREFLRATQPSKARRRQAGPGDGGHAMSAPKRKALGRGLAALIPGAPAAGAPALAPAIAGRRRRATALRTIADRGDPPLARPAAQDVRRRAARRAGGVDPDAGHHPAAGRAHARGGGGYELIAGERRWRAAQRAGLHEVPAVVRDVAPTQAFEMALVENLQREDLNPIEEAAGYQRLVDEFGYTQEQLAERVGKDRSTVANALRLLRLPESVRGAGRRRAALDGPRARAARPRSRRPRWRSWRARSSPRELSVRQVEELVRRARSDGKAAAAGRAGAARRPSTSARDLAMRLTRALGTRVEVVEVGPGARPDRDPLPFARSARRAPRKADALVSRAASLELIYRSDAALLVAYATHLARGQLLLDTTERLAERRQRCSCGWSHPRRRSRSQGVVARAERRGARPHPTEVGLTLTSRAETFGDAVDKLAFGFKGLKALVAASQAAPRALLIRYLRSIVTCEVIEIDQRRLAEPGAICNVDLASSISIRPAPPGTSSTRACASTRRRARRRCWRSRSSNAIASARRRSASTRRSPTRRRSPICRTRCCARSASRSQFERSRHVGCRNAVPTALHSARLSCLLWPRPS